MPNCEFPYPGNIIPSDRMTNSIVQKVLSYYPMPNTTGVQGIYNNFVFTPTRKTTQNTFLARVDQNFGSRHKAFVAVGRHAYTGITPSINIAFPQTGTNGDPGGATNTAWTGTISDTWTIRPNLLAEFRGNFVHSFFGTLIPSQGFDVGSLGLPASFVQQRESKVFPQFQIGDQSYLGIQNSAVDAYTEGSNQGQAHLTWVTGPHTVKTGLSRAIAEYNRPNYLVMNYIYQLPFGQGHQVLGKGAVGHIIGNWQWSGVTTYGSGLPVVITVPNNTNLPGIGAVADRIHDPHLKNGAQNPDKWFDTSAYAIPAPFTTGNGNRNEPRLRGPAYGDWDLSLDRKQQFGERASFELRFEAFNAFNNRNLGTPDGSITDGTFGQITSSGQPLNLQIGARLAF